jgi:hypothetical protein
MWRVGRSNSGLIAFNLVAFAAVILMFVFASVHWVEWLPGAMFLLFPIVLGVLSRTLEPESIAAQPLPHTSDGSRAVH